MSLSIAQAFVFRIGASIIVTIANVPFNEVQKLVRLKNSQRDLIEGLTILGIALSNRASEWASNEANEEARNEASEETSNEASEETSNEAYEEARNSACNACLSLSM